MTVTICNHKGDLNRSLNQLFCKFCLSELRIIYSGVETGIDLPLVVLSFISGLNRDLLAVDLFFIIIGRYVSGSDRLWFL